MGTVFRKTVTRPLPSECERFKKDGLEFVRFKAKGKKRVAKVIAGRDGKERIAIESGSYVAKFRNHLGIVQVLPTGCKDESAAIGRLNEFIREDELIRHKIITPTEMSVAIKSKRSTIEHLAAYLQSMRSAGLSATHIVDTDQKVNRLVAECEFNRLNDIDRERMEQWLLNQSNCRMAPRTRNGYLQAIRGFLNWCIETSRLTSNPLKKVAKADEKIDRRKLRRAMTETELSELLRVALLRPLAEYGRKTIATVKNESKRSNWTYLPLGLETLDDCCTRARERLADNQEFIQELEQRGRERMLVYKTLVTTGLRCNELRSITIGQTHLGTDRPFIELLASDEKNREGSFIPLRADLADELRQWIADSTEVSNRMTVSGMGSQAKQNRSLLNVPNGLIKILDRDLSTAGIAKVDDRGRSLDVHALRTTFGTMLSKAGVAPRTAQAAMRHSRIDLTMNVYTDPIALDIVSAVESLPTISAMIPSCERMAKTGTENGSPTVAPTVAPATVQTGQNMTFTGKKTTVKQFSETAAENEKTLEITGKSRVFDSEVDGARTRNLRIDSPVL